jgi:putative nucleotidyltransferase with HDIG domain
MLEQEVLEMLTAMVEDKDVYTAGHSKRVAMYSVRIAEALGLSEEEQTTIYQAGLLHDIGKILTPESVLLKPRKFNRSEYAIIKNHSTDGEKMVLFISSFKQYANIIRHHHERYDGEGYPDGLKGETIPLLSRIMSIADAFDAMTTNRIYKTRKTIDQAILELKKNAGTQFDPSIIENAFDVFASFKNLIGTSQNPDNVIQEERFAYFFKDSLTNVYSSEYLNFFLRKNKETYSYRCCYFVQLHHTNDYNERYGWKCGDELLKEIALRIRVLFHSSFVFRVFGDDFIVLNSLHVTIDSKEVIRKLCVGFNGISTSLQHFDLNEHSIDTWDQLENYLVHCE